ncbi:MAG TPA: SpoIIE family protein phosphatase [Pyrinomonadaceae bacterium]|nr:SpoIIE family protein phosphatase [Pyrinomonadaceae bacterium]
MRVLPRFILRPIRPHARKIWAWRRHLTVARVMFALQCVTFGAAVSYLLTGSRARLLDEWGPRADAVALTVASILFGLLHRLGRRRLVPWLDRYFSPAAYDEHRILFDLGQEAHAAATTDQLYHFIVNRIREAVDTDSVAVFVRDDATGDFVCRASTQRDARLAPHQTVTTGGGEPAPDCSSLKLSRRAFTVQRLQSLALPLSVTAEDFETWDRAFASEPDSAREARARERRTLQQAGAHLLVQIRLKNRLVGILSVGPRKTRHRYTQSDAEMLMSVASQLAFVIENSKMAERMVAEERLRRDLVLAAEVQQQLFPARAPTSSAAELAGFCQPARGIGGDYYDFLTFGNNKIGVAVADVSGKGISAALLMSNVQASLRSQALAHNSDSTGRRSLAELVSAMNRLLCSSTGPASYVTFFYGEFDEGTRKLTYVNAGHNPPMLLRDGETEPAALGPRQNGGGLGHLHAARPYLRLDKGGMVVGLFEDVGYEEETVQLRPGDLLLAYTDGVTEAENAAGEEFGEAQLQEVLTDSASLPAAKIRDEIVRRVLAWCEGQPQHDDLTFVVLKVK